MPSSSTAYRQRTVGGVGGVQEEQQHVEGRGVGRGRQQRLACQHQREVGLAAAQLQRQHRRGTLW
jgi:hypothetical protein